MILLKKYIYGVKNLYKMISGLDFKDKLFLPLIGKISQEHKWLPVWAHLLDTAGVMEYLLNHWISPSIVAGITKRNKLDDFDKLCVFVALVHDMGKFTPIFQSKLLELFSEFRNLISQYGIEIPRSKDFYDPNKSPHEYAGEAILLKDNCPQGIAAIVGAHHGKPFGGVEIPEEQTEYYEENFYGINGEDSSQGQRWNSVWDEWLSFALDFSGYETMEDVPDIDVPAQILLSGLLIMSDWIASNQSYAPLILNDDKGFRLSYPKRIESICKKMNFPESWTPYCFFMDDEYFLQQFGFYPNTAQRQMIEAVENSSTAGIYILEAQMGLGKTEAALAAAELLASKYGNGGIFFGLPTQATANGIFPRLIRWAENQSEDVQHSIRLAHGMAMMNSDYKSLFHGSSLQNEDSEYCENKEYNKESGLIVHSWFEGRKQALLSTFVVGTIDQLLMASLKQKHVMLRHIGLAGKVVIIDECHAYDAYMNRYLDRTLYWLGIYNVPVIILSATLPSKRRKELIEAYHHKPFEKEADNWKNTLSYPLLTWTDENEVKQCRIPIDTPVRKVEIIKTEEQELTSILKANLSNGGCAGVVVNTVVKAQRIAKFLKETFPDKTVMLIHARYTMSDRSQREETILKSIGKKSLPEQRNNLIVVGTQILEQSLDIDFDLLITELCPTDLLLQRIGRLHRHKNRQRPDLLSSARCFIMNTGSPDDGSVKVYGEWILKRTAQLLPKEISLPDDISPLVQETYRDMDENEELYGLWKEYKDVLLIKERKADAFKLPLEENLDKNIHGLLDSGIGNGDEIGEAKVRDSEMSVYALVLLKSKDDTIGFLPWQNNGSNVPFDRIPSDEECCEILKQRVQLPRQLSVYSNKDCIEQLESSTMEFFKEWQYSNLLKEELVLLLDEKYEADLCGYKIVYSEEYGLTCEKEEK